MAGFVQAGHFSIVLAILLSDSLFCRLFAILAVSSTLFAILCAFLAFSLALFAIFIAALCSFSWLLLSGLIVSACSHCKHCSNSCDNHNDLLHNSE